MGKWLGWGIICVCGIYREKIVCEREQIICEGDYLGEGVERIVFLRKRLFAGRRHEYLCVVVGGRLSPRRQSRRVDGWD